jgi:DNA sulfur modification protein DndD
MKLLRLTLRNFRQFRGEQALYFADLDERNVTVIHAENGFGKTALLNALLWGFYGHEGLTSDFAGKDSILNKTVAASSIPDVEKTTEVEISFEHEGHKYRLMRSLPYLQEKADSRKTLLTLEVNRDGQTFTERLPDQKIRSIIPKGIAPLIFFNGEGIDRLAMEESADQVREAIRQMLGLSLLQQTSEDLRHTSVRGRFRTELRESASAEIAELLQKLEDLEGLIERRKITREQAKKNLNATEADIEAVDASLANNRQAQELQHKRQGLEASKSKAVEDLAGVTRDLSKMIAEDGYSLFTTSLVSKGRAIVTRLRNENRIPARVLNVFIEDLLNSDRCICQRCLPEGSEERAAVMKLLTTAGDQNVNNAVGAIDNALGRLEELGDNTRERLHELNARRLKLKGDINFCENAIAEIHQQLGNRLGEEVRELEDKRRVLQDRRDDCIGKIHISTQQIEDEQAQAEQLRKTIDAAEATKEAAELAKRRVAAVEESAKLMDALLEAETESLVPMLNQKIHEHFDRIIDRPHRAELTPDFRFSITQEIGSNGERVDVNQSTGQRQITSLVFIASLVSLAQERAKIPTILRGLSGAAYPMVMDSPFGQLSTRFRKGIAEIVPFLAPQVILFASSEQYFGMTGAVSDQLENSNRIGKRYYLTYHAPSHSPDASDELNIGGQRLQQYFQADEECTEIREI